MTASLFLPRSSVPHIRSLQLYGVVQASTPISPVDDDWEEIGNLEILLQGSQYYPSAQAYRVVGHSMSGLIEHGDIVLVDTNDEFNQRRPCVFASPNGYVVKLRGLDEKGKPALLSTNPNFGPIRDRSEFRPIGCVYAIYDGPFKVRRL